MSTTSHSQSPGHPSCHSKRSTIFRRKSMKTNSLMNQLLIQKGVHLPSDPASGQPIANKDKFTVVQDCVLLKKEAEQNAPVNLRDFPDRTGFEAFVNHVHLPFDGTTESLQFCIT